MNLVQADHLAETRRLFQVQQHIPNQSDAVHSDAQIHAILWTTRALPLVIDALTDTRSEVQLDGCRWGSVQISAIPDRKVEGQIWMAATYRARATHVDVALFDLASPLSHPRPAWLQIRFELDWQAARPMDVSIQRFRIP